MQDPDLLGPSTVPVTANAGAAAAGLAAAPNPANPLAGMITVESSMCVSASSEEHSCGHSTPADTPVSVVPAPRPTRRLPRIASLPAPQYFSHDRAVRVNCLYVSRKQLTTGLSDAFSTNHVNNAAPVVLAPGLQASAQVVKASKAVKAYQVFDFRLENGSPRLSDLESEVRRNLAIPLGVELDMKVIPMNGDHATRITTDQQLSAAIAAHQDEITVQVMKSGIRLYLPWASILVSLADTFTTIYYATRLLRQGQPDSAQAAGIIMLCATLLAVALNLVQAFYHIKKSIRQHPPTHEWVTVHVCETALGLLLAGFNILNLECLWSHFDIGRRLNFHCPMPPGLQRMSGKNSIPSLFLGDGIPIAVSIFEMAKTRNIPWYTAASVGTSCASLALSVIKKVIVVLFVNSDADSTDPENIATAPGGDARPLLQRRRLAVVRVSLAGLDDLQQRPRLLASLSCKYHEVVHIAVRTHGGSVLGFTEGSVDAVFNAPREVPDYCVKAAKCVLHILRVWPEACEGVLGTKKDSMFNITAGIVCDEAFFGSLGPLSRKELKVVGRVMDQVDDFASLARHEGAVLANTAVQVEAHREGILVRQCDVIRNVSTGDHTPVYQVIDPQSVLAKQWGGVAVNLWSSLCASLMSSTIAQCLDLLAEYQKVVDPAVDRMAEGLQQRLLRHHRQGSVKYWRDKANQGRSLWSEPLESPTPRHKSMSPQQTHTLNELLPALQAMQTAGHAVREWSASPPCHGPVIKQLPSQSMSPSPNRPTRQHGVTTLSLELRDVPAEAVAETLGLPMPGEERRVVGRSRGIGSCISVHTSGGSSECGLTWTGGARTGASVAAGSSFCLTQTALSRVSSHGGGLMAPSAGVPVTPTLLTSPLGTPSDVGLDTTVSSLHRISARPRSTRGESLSSCPQVSL